MRNVALAERIARANRSIAAVAAVGFLFAVSAFAAETPHMDPDAGVRLAQVRGDDVSDAKWAKLSAALEHGGQQLRQAQFSKAIEWYESALQLAPDRQDIQDVLDRVRQLLSDQKVAQAVLPEDAAEREAHLGQLLADGRSALEAGQHSLAAELLGQLWLIEGDYKFKTLDLYERSLAGSAQNGGGADPVADVASAPIAAPEAVASPASLPAPDLSDATQLELDRMHMRAVRFYDARHLDEARDIWRRMLDLSPGNKVAQTWLANTEAAMMRAEAAETARSQAEERKSQARELLNAPITIATGGKTPLSEFMGALSFATPVELQYYIAEGAEAQVVANFVDKPLSEVLDTVLVPRGLGWSMDDKNVVTIEPKFISRTYTVSSPEMRRLRLLYDEGRLQDIVWGQVEKPAEGVNLILDERQNMVVITGSQLHIDRLDSFLPSLGEADAPALQVKIYKIRPQDGPRIKSLISSIIAASSGKTPFDLERKVLVDGEDLIVRDTLENIAKIEDLLLDKKFIEDLRREELELQNFSLVPKSVENIKSDYIKEFTGRVVEAVKTFLYAREGESKAAQEGRRLWYDPYTFQLTVVDTPANIQRISQYIESLPELEQESHEKVVMLRYQTAADIKSDVDSLTRAGAGQVMLGGGEQVIRLNRFDEREVFEMTIRANRFDTGDEQDTRDEVADLTIIIPGTGPNTLSITEGFTETLENYLFIAEEVSASGNGEGSIRLRIKPFDTGTGSSAAGVSTQAVVEAESDIDPRVIAVERLNALIIRYIDPVKYQRTMDLIEQLDIPTKQVQIETKFVEVNETRAKEVSSQFNLAGLTGQGGVDFGQHSFDTRFANDFDEYRDIFSPPIENPLSANLLKGTTVFSGLFGASGGPQIDYKLRLLEAEGIINIVNGPRVLALNNEQAFFKIEQYAPENVSDGWSTNYRYITGYDESGNPTIEEIEYPASIVNPFDGLGPIDMSSDALSFGEPATNDRTISSVVLTMTPNITSEDSIILNDLQAELIDFESWMGETIDAGMRGVGPYDNSSVTYGSGGEWFHPWVPVAVGNRNMQMLSKRKRIVTVARISNGGTIVIGGWTGERSQDLTSGVPVLRNMPYIGKMFFSRSQRTRDRTTLLIFLTGNLVD